MGSTARLSNFGGRFRGRDMVCAHGEDGTQHPTAVHGKGPQQIENGQHNVYPQQLVEDAAADSPHILRDRHAVAHRNQKNGGESLVSPCAADEAVILENFAFFRLALNGCTFPTTSRCAFPHSKWFISWRAG